MPRSRLTAPPALPLLPTLLLLAAALLVLLPGGVRAFPSSSLEHEAVEREVDLRSAKEEVTVVARVVNRAAEGSGEGRYFVAVPEEKADNLSFLRVTVGGAKRGVEAEFKAVEGGFEVELPKPLGPGEATTVKLLFVYVRTMRPLPAEIKQDDDQYVEYVDSAYFLTPYPTDTMETTVRLASPAIEFRTKKKPSRQTKTGTVVYGEYEGVQAYAHYPIRIHFKNNAKFATFRKVTRDIEVSHWGNVAVEERVWLEHTGAKMTGPFHRVDFENPRKQSAQAGFNELVAHLPAKASDIYYVDGIGNISTSNVHRDRRSRHTMMRIEPRFPIMGGWKTTFRTGFNVEASGLLGTEANDPTRYVLNTTFSTPFREAVVDEIVLRVILPEGATNIRLHVPFAVDSEDRAVHKTYLDTVGRPTVIFRKRNLVHYHDDYFQVFYTFSRTTMLVEPLMLSAMFFVTFAAGIVYNRIELSLKPGGTNAKVKST